MAKPTTIVEKKEEQPTLDLDVLVKQFLDRREAFDELLDIVQLLHEKGILRAVRAALARYEELIGVIAEWLASMGDESPTKLLELVGGLAKMDAGALTKLLAAASNGVRASQNQPTPSLESLLKALEEEQVRRGLQVLIQILRELGSIEAGKQGEAENS